MPNDETLESSIIDHLLKGRRAPDPQLQVEPGDDAAVLADGTVLTKDVLVQGIHFDDRISADDLGWKAIAVNVSDVAAMGGQPRWALLGLSLPRGISSTWIADFARGLHSAAERWGVDLIGGDTTRSPGPIIVSLSLIGTCERPMRRDQARPGDQIWVSGNLGDAAQGFFHGGKALQALHRPLPPLGLSRDLARIPGVHAMMDLSDGLALDLHTLCHASGVGAVILPEALPAADWLSSGSDRLALQVAFGEDYQLLFTAEPGLDEQMKELAKAHGIRLSCIGRVQEDPRVELQGACWPAPLFHHFDPGART